MRGLPGGVLGARARDARNADEDRPPERAPASGEGTDGLDGRIREPRRARRDRLEGGPERVVRVVAETCERVELELRRRAEDLRCGPGALRRGERARIVDVCRAELGELAVA